MKKGFTMIELIFVIVILGILASVAIPRLAGTKADAEISAAVANLRTLVSDASVYLVAKGEFPTGTKWNQITNVPLTNAASADATADGNLKVGGVDGCIKVKMVDRAGDKPAYIEITKLASQTGVCKQVQDADSLKPYFEAKVNGVTVNNGGAIAIGSSTSIYTTTAAAIPAVAATTIPVATPKPAAVQAVVVAKPAPANKQKKKQKPARPPVKKKK